MGPELLLDRAERACSAAGCDQGRRNGDGVKGEASDEVKVRLPGEDLAGLPTQSGIASLCCYLHRFTSLVEARAIIGEFIEQGHRLG